MTVPENKIYFKNLDALRFLAAFLVIVHHFHDSWVGSFGIPTFIPQQNAKLTTEGNLITTLIHNGSFGVEIFFIISGFLITYLLLEEKKKYEKINLFKFYTRRALRIWPLYFLLLAITPYIIKLLKVKKIHYLSSIFFVSNYDLIAEKGWSLYPISHIWSICVEEHFYLILPFIIVFVPLKHLPAIFCTLIFFSIGYRSYIGLYKPDWMRLYVDTGCRADTLLIGSLIGYYHHIKPINLSFSRWIRFLALVLLIFMLMLDDWAPGDNLYFVAFKKYGYLVLAVFLICNFLFNPKPLINFNNGVLKYFGKISYGMYMYGNVITPILFFKFFISSKSLPNFFLLFLIYFASVLLVSALSYELYEKWFLKLKSRFEVLKTR